MPGLVKANPAKKAARKNKRVAKKTARKTKRTAKKKARQSKRKSYGAAAKAAIGGL